MTFAAANGRVFETLPGRRGARSQFIRDPHIRALILAIENSGMSDTLVAKKSGVSQQMISALRNERRRAIRFGMYVALAESVGYEIRLVPKNSSPVTSK